MTRRLLGSPEFMRATKMWNLGRTVLALLLASVAAPAAEEPSKDVEGSLAKVRWGKHWAGPELKGARSLEGKVVLLKIWGG